MKFDYGDRKDAHLKGMKVAIINGLLCPRRGGFVQRYEKDAALNTDMLVEHTCTFIYSQGLFS